LAYLSIVAAGFFGLCLALLSNGFGIVPTWVLIVSCALYALAYGIFPDPSILRVMRTTLIGSILIVMGPAVLVMLLGNGGLFDTPQPDMFSHPTGNAQMDEITKALEAIQFFAARYILLLGAFGACCASIVYRWGGVSNVEIDENSIL
jgi:hypothetical protein